MNLSSLLISLFGAGGMAAAVRAWLKSNAETESISVETMRDVIGELRGELDRLRRENRELHEQVTELRRTVDTLTGDEPPPEYV